MTTTSRARRLRRGSTDAERKLWKFVRNREFLGLKFRRQQPLGQYVVDFVCFEKRLIIEVDGGQHSEQVVYDSRREEWLESQGFQVLRFWNNQVLGEFEGVQSVIMQAAEKGSPSP